MDTNPSDRKSPDSDRPGVNPRANAANTAFAAILMLLYGWYFSGATGLSKDPTYNAAVDVFPWALRGGGVLMLIAAIVSFMGLRVGLLIDSIATGLSGVALGACALVWLTKSPSIDVQDVVILVFSLILVRAAWIAWQMFSGPPARPAPPPPPDPIHPASLRPESLPKEGEPPPPDGYLSALAKEKEEPPTASYE